MASFTDLAALGRFTINLDAGVFTGGTGAPEGGYPFEVTKVQVSGNADDANGQSLALNLKFDGVEREIFAYVSLPKPGHDKAKNKDKDLNTFLICIGAAQEGQTGKIEIDGPNLAAIFAKFNKGVCYYIPQEKDGNGTYIKNSEQIDFIAPSKAAAVLDGTTKIERRKSGTSNNSLGSATGVQSPAGGLGGGALGATTPQPPSLGGLGGGALGAGGPVPVGGPALGSMPGLGGLGK